MCGVIVVVVVFIIVFVFIVVGGGVGWILGLLLRNEERWLGFVFCFGLGFCFGSCEGGCLNFDLCFIYI